MSLSSRSVKTPSVKKVSFQETTQHSFVRESRNDRSSVEISELFPKLEVKSILRDSVYMHATLTPMSEGARTFLNKRRRRREYLKPEIIESRRRNQSFLPPKEPTETLAHAMLRSMTHKIPPKKSKIILPKIALVTEADQLVRSGSPQSLSTARSHGSLKRFSSLQSLMPRNTSVQTSFDMSLPYPEITTSSNETNVINFDRECGYCRQNWRHRRKPASGFCKFCDEFLCSDCILQHRGRLTRLHPVVVFFCETCKEMNILNRKGAGYCVKCKHFYCSVCVVLHCSKKNHEVLEGKDLLDVTDVMIEK